MGTVTGSGPDITVAFSFSQAHTVVDALGYHYSVPYHLIDGRYYDNLTII